MHSKRVLKPLLTHGAGSIRALFRCGCGQAGGLLGRSLQSPASAQYAGKVAENPEERELAIAASTPTRLRCTPSALVSDVPHPTRLYRFECGFRCVCRSFSSTGAACRSVVRPAGRWDAREPRTPPTGSLFQSARRSLRNRSCVSRPTTVRLMLLASSNFASGVRA